MLQELQQQAPDLAGLLLLHPMTGAIDQVTAEHAGAGSLLHCLIDAGTLISAPVLLSRNETGGHIDGAARPGLQFAREFIRRAAAIPLQAALESRAFIFGAVEGK